MFVVQSLRMCSPTGNGDLVGQGFDRGVPICVSRSAGRRCISAFSSSAQQIVDDFVLRSRSIERSVAIVSYRLVEPSLRR